VIIEGKNLARHISILKPDPKKTDGQFLAFLLAAPQIGEQARAVATGTAQLTIPLSGLRAFMVPYPAREEQQEIVRRIETAFAWLDRVAAEHANASRLLPKLDQAILTKAFRGELLSQDPNDAPVST
jgi:type I restriction enzyme, S subunit